MIPFVLSSSSSRQTEAGKIERERGKKERKRERGREESTNELF
jgi:hypothetical protein